MTAIVLSIVALVLSVLSLGWQVVSWRLNGPVLTVDVTSTQISGLSEKIPDGTRFVMVKVVNRGRAATTIDGWGFESTTWWGLERGDRQLLVERGLSSASLPARLEPHSSIALYARADEVGDWLTREHLRPRQVRAWVRPATGDLLHARRRGVPLH